MLSKKKVFIAGVASILVLTTGCSPTSTPSQEIVLPEVTQTAEEELPWAEVCDTPGVDPLTASAHDNWHSKVAYCPTDKVTPQPALAALDIGGDLEPCQLIETSPERIQYNDNSTGFPRISNEWRLKEGEYNVQVIAFDWPDLKDSISPMEFLPHQAEMYSKWYETFSHGKVKLNVDVYPQWITLSEESSKFSQAEADQVNGQWSDTNRNKVSYFWNSALKAADPYIDFTDVDIVMFVGPRNQTVFDEFNLWPPGTGTFQTDEGPIMRGFANGSFHFRPENQLYGFWAHETLHYFKMPDLYWVDQGSDAKVTFDPLTYPAPIYGYDIMTTANSMRYLDAWLLWLLGWTSDSEYRCLTEENFQDSSFEIVPSTFNNDRTKAVIIKISDSKALVIESRRETEFDTPIARSRNGVIIYQVDTTIGHGQGALTLIAPAGRTLIETIMPGQNYDIPLLDGMFYEGNSIDIAGYHISVNKSLEQSDVVSISKIPDRIRPQEPGYVCITPENRNFGEQRESIGCPLNL